MYFEWSDGTPVTYTKWLRGEPTHANNRQEDCVVMKGKVKSYRYWLNYLIILFIFFYYLSFGQEHKSRGYNCFKQPILESYRCYVFEEESLLKVARKLFLLSSLRSREVVAFLEGNCPRRFLPPIFLDFSLCTWAFLKKLFITLWSAWTCKCLSSGSYNDMFDAWIFSALTEYGIYSYLKKIH